MEDVGRLPAVWGGLDAATAIWKSRRVNGEWQDVCDVCLALEAQREGPPPEVAEAAGGSKSEDYRGRAYGPIDAIWI